MLPEKTTNTNIGIAAGVVLQLLGAGVVGPVGTLLMIGGAVAFIWGCGNYALGKGYSAWLGLLGIASLIGLVILVVLPDRYKSGHDPMAHVNVSPRANDHLLFMCLVGGLLVTGSIFVASRRGQRQQEIVIDRFVRPEAPVTTSPPADDIRTFSQQGPEGIRQLVNRVIDSEASYERNLAQGELQRIGPAAMPALIEALNDDDARLRRWGGVPGQIPPLFRVIQALTSNPESGALVEALQAMTRDHDQNIRGWASYALSRGIGWQVPPAPSVNGEASTDYRIEHLQHEDPPVRLWAVHTLGRQQESEEVVRALRDSLQDEDDSVRREAVLSLGYIGANCENEQCIALAEAALTDCLTGGSSEVRASAAVALSSMGSKSDKLISVLVDSAADPRPGYRGRALGALSQIGGTESVRAILTAFDSDVPSMRMSAAQYLVTAFDENALSNEALVVESVTALAGLLDEPARNPIIHVGYLNSVAALIRKLRMAEREYTIASEMFIPRLLTHLQSDEDPLVRAAAAEVLGAFGSEATTAATALIDALGTSPVHVRQMAAKSLAQIDKNKTNPAAAPLSAYRTFVALDRDWDRQVDKDEAAAFPRLEQAMTASGEPPSLPVSLNQTFVAQRDTVTAAIMNVSSSAHQSENRHGLRFNGRDSRVFIPTLWYSGDESITLECWVKGKGECLGNSQGAGFGMYLGDPDKAWFRFHDGSHYETLKSKATVSAEKATHVAATFDGQRIQLFVDGRAEASRTVQHPHRPSMLTMMIGANPQPSSPPGQATWPQTMFNGEIYEVRVSRVVRYDENFEPTLRFEPDSQTIALYHFDEGAGQIAIDSSGNHHHGQIWNAEWVQESIGEVAEIDSRPAWDLPQDDQ